MGGEKTGAITAFDPATGDMKWSWDGDSPAYASPVIFESRGVRQVVTQSRQNIIGLDEATGKLLWKIPFTTAFEQNIVTPLVYKDTLIFSGIDKGVFAVRVDQGSTQTLWQTKDASMYMNSPVLIGDLLIGFSYLKRGQIFCLDPRTGAMLWTGSPRGGDNAAMLASATTLFSLTSDAKPEQINCSKSDALQPLRPSRSSTAPLAFVERCRHPYFQSSSTLLYSSVQRRTLRWEGRCE